MNKRIMYFYVLLVLQNIINGIQIRLSTTIDYYLLSTFYIVDWTFILFRIYKKIIVFLNLMNKNEQFF